MNLSEIVSTHGWRSFMAKLYGFGASIVIIGALFKIQHWPMAGTFLTVGLLTEATIFFFSAFEPLHEDVDWTLVYPELAGLTDEEELKHYKRGPGRTIGGGGGGGDGTALAKFDELLEKGNIGEELFNKLGNGLQKLSQTTNNLNDISQATVATKEYTTNVKSAAQTVQNVNKDYSQNAETLNGSMSQLNSTYKQLSDTMSDKFQNISNNNTTYSEKLELLNKNLAALNAVYELQLQGANERMKDSDGLYKGLNEMMLDLKASINETKQYKEEITKLSKNLAELNQIYGNMLAAMSLTTTPSSKN